jgi:hypothetical protein
LKTLVSTFQILLALSVSATCIVPVTNSSSVRIDVNGSWYPESMYYPVGPRVSSSQTESAVASLSSPFVAAVYGDAIFDIGEFAHAESLQNSSANRDTIYAIGSVYTRSSPLGEWIKAKGVSGFAHAASVFDLIFQVNETASYVFNAMTYDGPNDLRQSSAIVLSLLGGINVFSANPNSTLSLTGVLEPGTYEITATAQSLSRGSFYDQESGRAGFTFTMDFTAVSRASVPDGGASACLLMGALVILLLWRGYANRRVLLFPC